MITKNSFLNKTVCLLAAGVLGAGGTGNLIASSSTPVAEPMNQSSRGDNSNLDNVHVQVEFENATQSNVVANHDDVDTQNDEMTQSIMNMLSGREKNGPVISQSSNSNSTKKQTSDGGRFTMNDWNRIARFYMKYMYDIDNLVSMSEVKDDKDFIQKAENDSLFCAVNYSNINGGVLSVNNILSSVGNGDVKKWYSECVSKIGEVATLMGCSMKHMYCNIINLDQLMHKVVRYENAVNTIKENWKRNGMQNGILLSENEAKLYVYKDMTEKCYSMVNKVKDQITHYAQLETFLVKDLIDLILECQEIGEKVGIDLSVWLKQLEQIRQGLQKAYSNEVYSIIELGMREFFIPQEKGELLNDISDIKARAKNFIFDTPLNSCKNELIKLFSENAMELGNQVQSKQQKQLQNQQQSNNRYINCSNRLKYSKRGAQFPNQQQYQQSRVLTMPTVTQ